MVGGLVVAMVDDSVVGCRCREPARRCDIMVSDYGRGQIRLEYAVKLERLFHTLFVKIAQIVEKMPLIAQQPPSWLTQKSSLI